MWFGPVLTKIQFKNPCFHTFCRDKYPKREANIECCLEPFKSHGKPSKYSAMMPDPGCKLDANNGRTRCSTIHNELKMIDFDGFTHSRSSKISVHYTHPIHNCFTWSSKLINLCEINLCEISWESMTGYSPQNSSWYFVASFCQRKHFNCKDTYNNVSKIVRPPGQHNTDSKQFK